MSFRAWCFAIAITLALSAPGHAQNVPASEDQPSAENATADGQNQSAEHQSPTIAPTTALQGIERAIRDLKAEIDQVEQERQRENSRRDLDAQESMAHWAEWMFYAAFATTVLTTFALWAIVRTLHHTKRAADSAQQAVKVTREVGRDQSRAYVHVERAEFSQSDDEAAEVDFACTVKLTVLNAGQTPAKRFEVYASCETTIPSRITEIDRDACVHKGGWSALGAGKEITIYPRMTHARPVAKLHQVHVFGYIEYETFFGEAFQSEFSHFRNFGVDQKGDRGRGAKMPRSSAKLKVYEQKNA